MRRAIYRTISFALSACAVWAQAAPAAFEVASIKPTAPPEMSGGRIMVRVGCSADPGRVNCSGITLKDMLTRAYGMKSYQISGPSWVEGDRWDVMAKIPDGAPAEKVPEMWQSLVTDRFHLVARRENKELPIYALVVGKNGPKLTPAEESGKPITVSAPDGSKVSLPAPPQGATTAFSTGGKAPGGAMVMDGSGKMQVRGSTLGGFSDMLSRMMDRPVLDMTNVEGRYDITLEISMEDMIGMKRMAGAAVMMHTGGEGAGGPAPDSTPRASIFSAVQQLGLKLEPRKSPVETLIVEKADRPSDN
jgi:uncharacterized protein (TIGR03435 family)